MVCLYVVPSERKKEKCSLGWEVLGKQGKVLQDHTRSAQVRQGQTLLSRWSWSHDSEQREWLKYEGWVGAPQRQTCRQGEGRERAPGTGNHAATSFRRRLIILTVEKGSSPVWGWLEEGGRAGKVGRPVSNYWSHSETQRRGYGVGKKQVDWRNTEKGYWTGLDVSEWEGGGRRGHQPSFWLGHLGQEWSSQEMGTQGGRLGRSREQALSSAWLTFALCSSSRQLGTRIRSSGQTAKLEVETRDWLMS